MEQPCTIWSRHGIPEYYVVPAPSWSRVWGSEGKINSCLTCVITVLSTTSSQHSFNLWDTITPSFLFHFLHTSCALVRSCTPTASSPKCFICFCGEKNVCQDGRLPQQLLIRGQHSGFEILRRRGRDGVCGWCTSRRDSCSISVEMFPENQQFVTAEHLPVLGWQDRKTCTCSTTEPVEVQSSRPVSSAGTSSDKSLCLAPLTYWDRFHSCGNYCDTFCLQTAPELRLSQILNRIQWKCFNCETMSKMCFLLWVSSSWQEVLTSLVALRWNMDNTWLIVLFTTSVFVILVITVAICLHCRKKGPLGRMLDDG